MKARPGTQGKTKATPKRSTKREATAPQHAAHKESDIQATASIPIQVVDSAEALPIPTLSLPEPVFVRRDINAPDGSIRAGWEMWIGEHCFGRADSKELLLASFQRLQSPPESFHWREVRNRMQMRGRPRPTQPEQEKEEGWEENETPAPAPVMLGEEEAEGFQELTWENPA
jgi:hypothetical protein